MPKTTVQKNFRKYRRAAQIAATVALGLALTAPTVSAQAAKIGVLGLYSLSASQAGSIDTTVVGNLGCELRLDGRIGAVQGKIDLKKPNRFVLLACDGSVLGDPDRRAILADLIPDDGALLATLEGDLTDFAEAVRTSAVAGRQYVLKISYYNNRDVDARDQELADLTQRSTQMDDRYFTESFIGVNLAQGMATPDEVVVLFYDDPQTGDRFRDANAGFLKEIGKFNKKHLDDTVYYVGQASN